MDANVIKGYTVTAQLQHRVEASCQHQREFSRLMGSKKVLRKREFQEF